MALPTRVRRRGYRAGAARTARRHPLVRDQAAGRADRRHRRLPGPPATRRLGAAAAHPRHRHLAQGARPARRPARQRPPERGQHRRRRPRRGPARQPVERVPARDPPLGSGPRLPRPAPCPAGPWRPALAVSRVRRVDGGNFSRGKIRFLYFAVQGMFIDALACATDVADMRGWVMSPGRNSGLPLPRSPRC
jgi:hypothetical protein